MRRSSAWTGASPHIDKSDLMCKTGCGYYGNPIWDGHCSKCFKELLNKKQKRPVFDPTHLKNKVSRSVSDVTDFPFKATSLVSRKLDKQHLQIGKKTKIVKDIFRKSHTVKSPSLLPQLSAESQTVQDELQSYLKSLCEDAHVGISKRIKVFVEKMCKIGINTPVDNLGEMFHEFYASLDDFLSHNETAWKLQDEHIYSLRDLIEKYVTTRLYSILSCNVHAYCEEKDLSLQKRIRSLMWITCNHLECKIDENNEEVIHIFDEVINDLIEIDGRRTPSGKLSVLVSASNQILCLLKKSSGGILASADDFLPALIYCILKANPPLLQSNICYVTNFALENSLQTGEAGYFFTNLCCAVSFIEKLTAESLSLTDAEFEHFMSGNALPANALNESYMCDAFRIMKQNIDTMTILEDRVNAVNDGYDKMVYDLEEFNTNISSEVKSILQRTPLNIRPKEANIDEPLPIEKLLPPPLQPQNINDEMIYDTGSFWSLSNSGNIALPVDDKTPKEKLWITSPSDDRLFDNNLPLTNTDNGNINELSSLVSPFHHMSPSLHIRKGKKAASLESSLNDLLSIDVLQSSSNTANTTSFTLQGETIQSIPCNTGLLSGTTDPFSPIRNTAPLSFSSSNIVFDQFSQSTSDNLPPPLIPLSSSPLNLTPMSNKEINQ